MRSFAVLFLVAFGAHSCVADRLENTYLPPNSAQSAGGNSAFLSAPRFGQSANLVKNYLPPNRGTPSKLQTGYQSASNQAAFKSAENIPILKFSNDNDGNGNYAFEYETANGIKAQETGRSQGDSEAVQGAFSYTGPDGNQYSVSYVADENGFRAVGDHLPTSPPIPEAILRSIQQNEQDEANGIVDDGSYKGETGNYKNAKTSYDNGYRY